MPRKQPAPVDRHVGDAVRQRRLAVGMSQKKLGAALDVTFQQVQKYENGINRISASRLHHIANILNVPSAFFFEGAPGFAKGNSRGPSPNIEIEFLAEGEGRALMQAFQRLPTRDLQRSVIALVEELADR